MDSLQGKGLAASLAKIVFIVICVIEGLVVTYYMMLMVDGDLQVWIVVLQVFLWVVSPLCLLWCEKQLK